MATTTLSALPRPRTPDPHEAPVLRWGVLGPGWIAQRFVESLQANTRQQVVAVGSRDQSRASAFAAQWSLPKAYSSYAAFLDDPDIDVVYIATTHPSHRDNAVDALNAGKHVLVEKPLALDAAGARDIATAAADANRFAGEAMWTKFLPKFDVIRQLLDDGVLGEVRTVIADHGEFFTSDHRIYDPKLAGGPLLDLGTYPIALAHMVFGSFTSVVAKGQPAASGLNGQISAILSDAAGNQALLHTTILSDTPTAAVISGRDATLHIEGPFYMPGPFSLTRHRGHPDDPGRVLRYDEKPGLQTDGLHYAAVEAARLIADDRIESETHPLRHAISTLEVVDEIRHQLG
jgi:predicted dehydrogenase